MQEQSMQISGVNEMISYEEAKENRARLVENLKKYGEDPESINLQEMCKNLKKNYFK